MSILPPVTLHSPSSLRILGIDPSLRSTGYGLIDWHPDDDSVTLVEGGVLRTPTGARIEERLLMLYNGVRDIIAEFEPQVVAVEDLFTRFKHPRTAILMAHARGALLLPCAQAGLPVVPYAPRLVKNAMVGHGAAKKPQIQARVQSLLKINAPLEPNDVADALAIALTHVQRTLRHQLSAVPTVGATRDARTMVVEHDADQEDD